MYFLSRDNTQVTYASFEEEIFRCAQNGDTGSYLYIVPTGAIARELINRVTELRSPAAITLPYIISLDDFIGRLSRAIKPEVRVLSDAESAVFVELVLKELLRRQALIYFEGNGDPGPRLPIHRGTFERLVAGIAGLKENGITPEKLSEDLMRAESDPVRMIADRSALRRARDIAAIYKVYEEKLGTTFTDKYGQYNIVSGYLELPSTIMTEGQMKRIDQLFSLLFNGVTDLFIGSFIKLPEPAKRILFALSHLQHVRLTFGIDYERNNTSLFMLQEQLIRDAIDHGYSLHVPINNQESITSDITLFRKSIQTSLFSALVKKESNARLHLYSHAAKTMRDEIRFAAKRIKEIISHADESPELSRICIASYRQDDYAPLAREIFREYGIPANITDRARLDRSPLYLAYSALVDLAEFNFSRRSLLRLLSSPYFLITGKNGTKIDAANLYAVISEFRLLQGSPSWLEEIDDHLEDLAEQRESASDDYDISDLELQQSNLIRARDDIEAVEKIIRQLKKKATPSEFYKTILDIIRHCRVIPQILTSSDAMLDSGELEFETRSYRAFNTLLEELLDTCAGLGLETQKLPLSFYSERIRIAALQTRFAPRAEPGRGVIITSFEQTIGYRFDYLFLVGMNDGVFPEIYSPSLFTMQEHQSGEDDKLIEQRYLFYQTLCTFNKEAFIIWHTKPEDKKSEIMRSQFADALEEVVPFIEIPAEPQTAMIFSANEYFRYAATTNGISDTDVSFAKEHGLDLQSLYTLEEQIPHALYIDKTRTDNSLTEFSGSLSFDRLTDTERGELLEYKDRVYSISQLETYAACPFKFFAKYILHLESGLQNESEEGISGSERGIILHDTLYRLLSGLRERNEDIRSISDEDFMRISTEILSTDSRKEKLHKNHPFWQLDKEAVFAPPVPGVGILQKFIDAERKYAAFITKPSFFEATFGLRIAEDKRDPALYREEYVEIDGMKLRGKIDRIDMDPDGNIFTVTDYKSGKHPSKKEIDKGMSLQLPLYLRISEDLLRAHLGDEAMSGIAAMYHSLLGKESKQYLALGIHEYAGMVFEGKLTGKRPAGEVESVEELEEIIETTIRFAKSYVEGIMQGRFPLVREENYKSVCTYCEFKTVCRVGEAFERNALRK